MIGKIEAGLPILLILIVSTLLTIQPASANPEGLADTPWPMFRHDPQHTGRSPYLGSQSAMLRWRYETGGWVFSSPAIGSDGTVYVGSYDYYLYALNPASSTYTIYFATDPPDVGSITFDGSTYSHGQASKYAAGTYSITATAPPGFIFYHWITADGVKVTDREAKSTLATVTGNGVLIAVLSGM